MRRVAAEARRVLLELGSERLGTPVAELAVSNATIPAKSDAAKSVTYAELVGGKRFDVALTGRNVDATTGTAAVKPVKSCASSASRCRATTFPPRSTGR